MNDWSGLSARDRGIAIVAILAILLAVGGAILSYKRSQGKVTYAPLPPGGGFERKRSGNAGGAFGGDASERAATQGKTAAPVPSGQ